MTDHFDKLRKAYAITLGDRLMPGAGIYGVGAITVVMPDEDTASAWLEEYAEELASLDRGPAAVAVLTAEDGSSPIYGPGDAIVMPKGFTGTWRQLSPIKKIHVSYSME